MDVIRLIASDLDATLLDDQSQLPPDFAETVRALAERGIRFAAASGRPIYTLEEMFAPLQDDIILVGDNGGAICWKGESLYLSEMDVADWHTLAGQARSAGHAAVLCGLETAYVEEQFRPYDRVFKRFYTKVEYVPHLEDVTARVDKSPSTSPREMPRRATTRFMARSGAGASRWRWPVQTGWTS